MKKEKSKILINVLPHCTRVINLKGDSIVSFYYQAHKNQIQSGSIYKGQVIKMLPTMASCFLDIGFDQSGFLYLDDSKNKENDSSIEIPKIKQGQSVMVQITKEPLGSKGPRLSTQINLVGPYLIYMPFSKGVRVSKQIQNEKERTRLIECIESLLPPGGVIVRSKSEKRKDFKKDLEQMVSLWHKVQKKNRNSVGLIHCELDPELQILRDDLLHPKSTEVWIDNKETYDKAISFSREFMPEFESKIFHYTKEEPLFEKFQVEKKIRNCLKRTVYLKSGSSIVIDENEALVSIDVNTSRFIGKKSQTENILKTNLEAVKEIAEQLRIRNCGGIIVIDIIDMKEEESKEQVMRLLEKELEKDRAHTEVISISDLNVIQMTRHRKRPSLKAILCQPCKHCNNYGWVKSPEALLSEFLLEIQKKYKRVHFLSSKSKKQGTLKTICLTAHPQVINWMEEHSTSVLEFLKNQYGIQITFQEDPEYSMEKFQYAFINQKN